MIHFFIGTKAQLIKMAPVMLACRDQGMPFRYVDSGQHGELTAKLRQAFSLSEPDYTIQSDGDVTSYWGALKLVLRCLLLCAMPSGRLRERVFPGGGVCVIHGDTLTTLLGLWLGRRAGLDVAHVEAGLRSFSVLDPFPEELVRIHCMHRCQLLFAPSQESYENLQRMKVKGRVVLVSGNTVCDSLAVAMEKSEAGTGDEGDFCLATCHRLETITSKRKLRAVVDALNTVSERIPVTFVVHKPTRKALERFGLMDAVRGGVMLLPMQNYPEFIDLVVRAKFVMADGGSIQEECGYLRKPCLILRETSERPDGLDDTATLWRFSDQVLETFLDMAMASEPRPRPDWPRPSRQIVSELTAYVQNQA